MDDEAVIELVKQTALLSKTYDSERIKAIETEIPHIIKDIDNLKVQKKEEPKEVEAKKDKRAIRAFQWTGALLGIFGGIISLINLLNNLLKKP